MDQNNLWVKANNLKIRTSPEISGNFDIDFDKQIPEETKKELISFIEWVEKNFYLPITLWVDFEYKHYVLNRKKQRMGHLFYWNDFDNKTVFDNEEDIPMIRLPVRTEYYTIEEILESFIRAITYYFAWLSNMMSNEFECNDNDVEEILNAYLSEKSK